jgi:6-phosphogluconolactonase
MSTRPPAILAEADAASLAARTAARLIDTLRPIVEFRGVVHVAITGGGILEKVIGALPDAGDLDWARVHVWWADERWVAPDSADRNDRAAFAAGLDRLVGLGLDRQNVHRMPADDGTYPDVEAAADAYAAELAHDAEDGTVPGFAAVLLGVGPDAHCASLFPHHPATRVVDRSVIAVHDAPKPPPTRLSFTFAALDAAVEVWFVASGESKAAAVALALSSDDPTAVPSCGPKGRERTFWLVDVDAAAELAPERYEQPAG